RERPVRLASRNIGEARPEIQTGERLAEHTLGGPGRAMRRAVVDARVAVHGEGRIGLGDRDRDISLGVVVVTGNISERPVRRAAGDIGEARPEIQTGERLAEHALGGPGGAMRRAVVDARVAVYREGRSRLADR